MHHLRHPQSRRAPRNVVTKYASTTIAGEIQAHANMFGKAIVGNNSKPTTVPAVSAPIAMLRRLGHESCGRNQPRAKTLSDVKSVSKMGCRKPNALA